MKTSILISAATERELLAVKNLDYGENFDIDFLLTGVGSAVTVYSLMKYLRNNKADFIVNVGIAGSFSPEHLIGDALVVAEDIFADLGIEEQTGFMNVWEYGLVASGEFPFENGIVYCEPLLADLLGPDIKMVRGITVNTASGNTKTIQKYIEKYKPDIETMEVAASLYVGRMEKIPVIALRTVSNFVEPRDKGNWDIEKALQGLENALRLIMEKIV